MATSKTCETIQKSKSSIQTMVKRFLTQARHRKEPKEHSDPIVKDEQHEDEQHEHPEEHSDPIAKDEQQLLVAEPEAAHASVKSEVAPASHTEEPEVDDTSVKTKDDLQPTEAAPKAEEPELENAREAVSYTHLTLPTKRIV